MQVPQEMGLPHPSPASPHMMFCCAHCFGAHAVDPSGYMPHTFGAPLPPQARPPSHVPQKREFPHPSVIYPQLRVAPQVVSGVQEETGQHCPAPHVPASLGVPVPVNVAKGVPPGDA
jgi:hypothetical protein